MVDRMSLQELHTPAGRCFGCGPANTKGLRIRSFPLDDSAALGSEDDVLVCDWSAEEHHEAFENVVNGGIVGALFDCHSNWAAAWHVMRRDDLEGLPVTVTADFHVKLRRPTPRDIPVKITAWVTESQGNKVWVEADMRSGDTVTARCTGTFVTVGNDHPAVRHGES